MPGLRAEELILDNGVFREEAWKQMQILLHLSTGRFSYASDDWLLMIAPQRWDDVLPDQVKSSSLLQSWILAAFTTSHRIDTLDSWKAKVSSRLSCLDTERGAWSSDLLLLSQFVVTITRCHDLCCQQAPPTIVALFSCLYLLSIRLRRGQK